MLFNSVLRLMFCASVALAYTRYDGHQVLRVDTPTQADVNAVDAFLASRPFDVDVWHASHAGGALDVRLAPEFVNAFRNACPLPSTVFVDDVQPMIEHQRRKSQDWFDAYHPLDELDAWLDDRAAQYGGVPGLTVELFNLGVSWENRTIRGISFHGTDTQRVGIFWNGVHHAREWIGPSTTHWLIDTLLSGYGNDAIITSLVNGIDFHIVPVLNVDGYTYTWTNDRLWRKTRSTYNPAIGTDPNRNWDFMWGGAGSSGTPSSGTYRGPFAFSEPEVQAAANFIQARPNIGGYIDWHSYGQYILSAWGYTPELPPDVFDHVALGNAMEVAVRAVNGNSYLVGPSGDTLYPTSGSAPDFTYANGAKYSYTIELPGNPGGFVLPPEYIIPVGRESWEGARVFASQILAEFQANL